MNFLLSIFLFIAPVDSLGLDEVVKRFKGLETYTELVQLVKEDIGVEDFDKNKISMTVERELGNNFQQIRFGFITEEYGVFFHVSLVKRGDRLMFCELSHEKKAREIVFDDSVIREYLELFNAKFGLSKNEKDFKTEIDKIWMFSNGCGFSGDPTEEWEEIEKFVKEADIDNVRKYLYAMDVESQAYGLIGMLKLKRNGIHLSKKDIDIMNYVESINSSVYTCMGCFLGEIVDMADLVKYWKE